MMTNYDILVYVFSRMDLDTVAHFMSSPMHYEPPQDPLLGKERVNNGGIRTVSRLWRNIFDNFTQKMITFKTFKAYKAKYCALAKNIVWLDLPSYNMDTFIHPNSFDYAVFVHLLDATQLRGLKVLRINEYSSYTILAKSCFMTRIIPGLNRIAEQETGSPLQLDVLSSGFTRLQRGDFLSADALTRLIRGDASEMDNSDMTIVGLIARCRTLDMHWTYDPYSAICVMKLASSAKTVRFVNNQGTLGYVPEETKEKILDVFGGGVRKIPEGLLSNFERLEINHCNNKNVSVGFLKSLCTGGVLAELPLLSGVREVCISRLLSSNYLKCFSMSSVRKLEIKDISVLRKLDDYDSEEDELDPSWAMEDKIFLRPRAVTIGNMPSCFPNLEVFRISLQPANRVEILERHTGCAPGFLEAILNELHNLTLSRPALEVYLCQGEFPT